MFSALAENNFLLNENDLDLMSVMFDGFRLVEHSNINIISARRSEPSSRTFLIGEQPNPWDLLQPQDKMSRHRGAEHRRRYELLGDTSLLSLG